MIALVREEVFFLSLSVEKYYHRLFPGRKYPVKFNNKNKHYYYCYKKASNLLVKDIKNLTCMNLKTL